MTSKLTFCLIITMMLAYFVVGNIIVFAFDFSTRNKKNLKSNTSIFHYSFTRKPLSTRSFIPHQSKYTPKIVYFNFLNENSLKMNQKEETPSSKILMVIDYSLPKMSKNLKEKIEPMMPHIISASRINRIPIYKILAIIHTESAFIVNARSHASACGLMQIIPETARDMIGKKGIEISDQLLEKKLMDPAFNIKLGVKLLKVLENNYGHIQDPIKQHWMVLSAYNAGPGWVRKILNCENNICLKKVNEMSASQFLKHLRKLPTETREYLLTVANFEMLYSEKIG